MQKSIDFYKQNLYNVRETTLILYTEQDIKNYTKNYTNSYLNKIDEEFAKLYGKILNN